MEDYLLGDEDFLDNEGALTADELLAMDDDGPGSDVARAGCFSRVEAERSFESRPVLETATRVSAAMRQEALDSKKSSSERMTDRSEDPGMEFRTNVGLPMEEESVAETDGRVLSVVRSVSPGAQPVDRRVVLGMDDTGGT